MDSFPAVRLVHRICSVQTETVARLCYCTLNSWCRVMIPRYCKRVPSFPPFFEHTALDVAARSLLLSLLLYVRDHKLDMS